MLDIADPTEYTVMTEVLAEAENLRVKRQEHFFQQLAVTIQNAIVKSFGGKAG